MEILDSGTRREFESGAVRDIADGKGRCDLLPLDIIANYMLGALWTQKHKPDLIDLPFKDGECPHRVWFGDMALNYCDKDKEICEDVTQCTKR